eukprot:768618-Hanusia_phi.AAC.2
MKAVRRRRRRRGRRRRRRVEKRVEAGRRRILFNFQQIISYTASMGFTPSKEIMTIEELVEEFDLPKVGGELEGEGGRKGSRRGRRRQDEVAGEGGGGKRRWQEREEEARGGGRRDGLIRV